MCGRSSWKNLILFPEGVSGRCEVIHEGGYSFRSKGSKNSPHIPSLRVFHNNFSRWSETFEIIAFVNVILCVCMCVEDLPCEVSIGNHRVRPPVRVKEEDRDRG